MSWLWIKKKLTPHPLTNHGIQKYYQNDPRFNGVCSRDNLPNKVKDGAYVVNLDEYSDIGTHWVALYVNGKTATYFDSFGIEHIPQEMRVFIADKDIIASIYRVQKMTQLCVVIFGLVLLTTCLWVKA